jgi:exodeoxyribonuclease VII large subunit
MDFLLPPIQCDEPYSVSEINAGIAAILEAGNTLVWIEGEISNFKRASSGHCYLKLRDEYTQIPAVLWRSNAAKLDFELEDGMAVMAIASLKVYQRGGYYQLDIHRIQPSGVGALYAAFEKLKRKLEQQGLFDEAHKKPLPESVRTLGVITARTGAAIRDIIKVVAHRAPQTDILLKSITVQGDKAPKEIVQAIQDMNDYGDVDVIIVGRGGGSVEDLWAFNDEAVAQAIYNSHIPVISAVGHEIDFTIADFVADVRAPTPSAAAEIAVPDGHANRRYFEALLERFTGSTTRYFTDVRERYNDCLCSPGMRKPIRMLSEIQQRRDELEGRQNRALSSYLRVTRANLSRYARQLQALSPLSVLGRGYSVVTNEKGETVRDAGPLKENDLLRIRFHRGEAEAEVRKPNC